VDVAVELSLFVARQHALLSSIREMVHSGNVAIVEANRQEIFSCLTWQLPLPELNKPGQYRCLCIWAGELGTHLISLSILPLSTLRVTAE
jgi:hypothetical protein